MWYVSKTPNEWGAYPNPQGTEFEDSFPLKDEDLPTYCQYNGFINFVENGDGYDIEPRVEEWEEWKKTIPEPVEYDPLENNETINFMAEAIMAGANESI